MDFCKYKNIFGEPNKGIHSYRLFNVAIMDVIMTFIAAYFVSYIFKLSYWLSCVILFALGIALHKLFCVKTTIDKLIFGI
jgi:hypothetical protein